ncbi:cyclin-dependent kinase inhibitor 1B-like [Dunckerocampus dactyliophorus]|uniref:cyclin-dependent kinase inhibitor 1B-like n=1 Tax=Dunckerocampus dactyliophorus TaxID=161453 RepID=UPI002405E1F3|nr:cyclin-dependent kinase inhibitor 1B-like [Dunckerocampus dactyliophorus]
MNNSMRRCLYGPVDHEQLRRDLKLELEEIPVEDSHRWNFDFQTNTPLPGMFEWEPVNCPADLCHDSSQVKDSCMLVQMEGSSHQEKCSSFPIKPPAEDTPVWRKMSFSKRGVKPTGNAQIRDVFCQEDHRVQTQQLCHKFHFSILMPNNTTELLDYQQCPNFFQQKGKEK